MTSQIKQFDPDRINKICRDLQRDLDFALGEVDIYAGIAKDLTARINSKRQRLEDLRRRIESTVDQLERDKMKEEANKNESEIEDLNNSYQKAENLVQYWENIVKNKEDEMIRRGCSV